MKIERGFYLDYQPNLQNPRSIFIVISCVILHGLSDHTFALGDGCLQRLVAITQSCAI